MAKAQKGDLIRIIKSREEEGYHTGELREVIERWGGDDGVIVKPNVIGEVPPCVYDEDYEIHRKAGEEDSDDIDEMAEAYSESFDDVMPEQDAVNSPNHYTQGRFETIEIIEEITQGYSDGYVAYCVGNALKYLARAPYKHGEPTEDIAKAGAYINFALERLQTQK